MDFKEITSRIINFGRDSPTYWGCALAGEVGEACNLIKKYARGDFDNEDGKIIGKLDKFKYDLGKELADIFNYLELVARYFKIDLEGAILNKIDEVLERREKGLIANA